jgi:hypothetical protein
MCCFNLICFFVGDYVADAASSAATGAAKATKEYASAGAHKTQEAFNEYVR